MSDPYDVVIIGGGIIGLATAMALKTGSSICLLYTSDAADE